MKLNLLLPLLLVLSACSSKTISDEYQKAIDAYSEGEVKYRGFDNTFQFRATIFNTPVQDAYIEQKTKIYKWDVNKAQSQRQKLGEKNGQSTNIWMSFYTPRQIDDNLHKKKSVWSLYLKTANGRYEGKVTRDNTSLTETMVLFPYHTPYATSYKVEFPVALDQIQGQPSTLIIAGPLGAKEVTFSGLE